MLVLLILCALGDFAIYESNQNFEDDFHDFNPDRWRIDNDHRHCGNGIGCMFASNDNMHYLSNPPVDGTPQQTNELMITMRNDCDEKHCCENDHTCTDYTSGQLTSTGVYGHGTFYFDLQLNKKVAEYEIAKTRFKSIKCHTSPDPEDFPRIMKATPTRGYCVNENADLSKYSSNRDLCDGVDRDICGQYTWEINAFSPSVINFNTHGGAVDYEKTAIFLNGKFLASGGRDLIQNFDVHVKAIGTHTIEIFGWENCCAGNYNLGYMGWTATRKAWAGGWFSRHGAVDDEHPCKTPEGQGFDMDCIRTFGTRVFIIGGRSGPSEEDRNAGEAPDEHRTPTIPEESEEAENGESSSAQGGSTEGEQSPEDTTTESAQLTTDEAETTAEVEHSNAELDAGEPPTEEAPVPPTPQNGLGFPGYVEGTAPPNVPSDADYTFIEMSDALPPGESESNSVGGCNGDEMECSTQEAAQTTMELSERTTEDPGPDSTEAASRIMSFYGAQLCMAMLRFVGGIFGSVLMKISMCFSSKSGKQATLVARSGDNIYREIVELPFDATKQMARYSINWLPDRISWKCNGEVLGDVGHDLAVIPNSPMHLKMFISPEDPIVRIDQPQLIEHQLHVLTAGYIKSDGNKDELIVIGKSENYTARIVAIAGVFFLLVAGVWFYWSRSKRVIADGYKSLLANEHKHGLAHHGEVNI